MEAFKAHDVLNAEVLPLFVIQSFSPQDRLLSPGGSVQRYCIKEGNRAGCFLPGWVRVTAPPGPFDPIATPITEHVNGQGMEAFAARDVVNAEGLPLSVILCDSPCSPCSMCGTHCVQCTEHVNRQGTEAFTARDVVNAEGLPLSMILCDSPCSPCSCHLEAVCNALSMRTGRERRHSRRFAPVAKLKQR